MRHCLQLSQEVVSAEEVSWSWLWPVGGVDLIVRRDVLWRSLQHSDFMQHMHVQVFT